MVKSAVATTTNKTNLDNFVFIVLGAQVLSRKIFNNAGGLFGSFPARWFKPFTIGGTFPEV